MTSKKSNDTTGIAQKVLLLVFVGGILEPLGMLLYLTLFSPTALETLLADGVSPEEVVPFLLASPDRLLVAGGIALLAVLFAWNADTSTGGTHYGAGGGGGGGGDF